MGNQVSCNYIDEQIICGNDIYSLDEQYKVIKPNKVQKFNINNNVYYCICIFIISYIYFIKKPFFSKNDLKYN
jgi:hypothetical protein